jgi:hypothetical protein
MILSMLKTFLIIIGIITVIVCILFCYALCMIQKNEPLHRNDSDDDDNNI